MHLAPQLLKLAIAILQAAVSRKRLRSVIPKLVDPSVQGLFIDPKISSDLELRPIPAQRGPNGLNLVRPIEATSRLLPHHTPPAGKPAS
jgi:hypothetical protein